MKLKGHIKSLHATCNTILIGGVLALLVYLLMGCAHNYIPVNCSDESIVAAQVYHRRTGRPTFIAKSADGTHAQAFTESNGRRVWLYVYPRFRWGIYETDASDNFNGGIGNVYTVDKFIRSHGPWKKTR